MLLPILCLPATCQGIREWAGLAAADAAPAEKPARASAAMAKQYLVLITCREEKHQVELLQRFQE